MKTSTKLLAVFVAVIIFGTASSTFAFGGKSYYKNISAEDKAAITAAIDSNDYKALTEALGENASRHKITEEKFAKIVAIKQKHQAVEEVIEAGDYTAWAALQKEKSTFAEKINADNFPRFVEMKQALKKAREIGEELGLKHGGKKWRGHFGKFRGHRNFDR